MVIRILANYVKKVTEGRCTLRQNNVTDSKMP